MRPRGVSTVTTLVRSQDSSNRSRKVLALCPCCEFQLRVSADKTGSDVVVEDLARFAASSLGYDFPASEPEVQAQWAVFEAMIALMTPEGFAELMGTM